MLDSSEEPGQSRRQLSAITEGSEPSGDDEAHDLEAEIACEAEQDVASPTSEWRRNTGMSKSCQSWPGVIEVHSPDARVPALSRSLYSEVGDDLARDWWDAIDFRSSRHSKGSRSAGSTSEGWMPAIHTVLA